MAKVPIEHDENGDVVCYCEYGCMYGEDCEEYGCACHPQTNADVKHQTVDDLFNFTQVAENLKK